MTWRRSSNWMFFNYKNKEHLSANVGTGKTSCWKVKHKHMKNLQYSIKVSVFLQVTTSSSGQVKVYTVFEGCSRPTHSRHVFIFSVTAVWVWWRSRTLKGEKTKQKKTHNEKWSLSSAERLHSSAAHARTLRETKHCGWLWRKETAGRKIETWLNSPQVGRANIDGSSKMSLGA